MTFAKGNSGEVDALVAAINANLECVVTAAKLAAGNGVLATATQATFATAGASPTIANADYSAAFDVLEASVWNVLCVDSDATAIHALVKAFINRATDGGLMGIAVVGEPTSVEYATRKSMPPPSTARTWCMCSTASTSTTRLRKAGRLPP